MRNRMYSIQSVKLNKNYRLNSGVSAKSISALHILIRAPVGDGGMRQSQICMAANNLSFPGKYWDGRIQNFKNCLIIH